MRHILLLTDFSKNSDNAIRYALQLFNEELCTFHVLHVKSSSSYTSSDLISAGSESVYSSIVKEAKHKLTKLVSTLKVDFKNDKHSFKTIVDYDVLTDSINQVIKANKINLIVMGTNGVTGAKEVLFGSNTINVIRQVNCTTLVIPEGFKYKKPKELLLPLDAFDFLHGKSFIELSKFITKNKLLFHTLRINPNGYPDEVENSDSDYIADQLKGKSFKYHIVNNVPMQHVVECYLQTNPIDFMALLVQKESLFERFFIGSPTTQISNALRVPLLIVHS